MERLRLEIAISFFFCLVSVKSFAYIGPGMGAGAFAIVVGIVSALFFAFIAVIFFPIKRLLTRRRDSKGHSKKPSEKKPSAE